MNQTIRILMVDDSPQFVSAARAYLQLHSALEVTDIATDGREALEKVQQGNLDVILLDLNLPDQSGLELIPALHRLAPNVKIIVLSMLDELSYRAASLAAGADAFVHKSVMSKNLVAAIWDSLSRSNSAPPIQSAETAERKVSILKLVENATDLIYRYDFFPVRGFTYVSPSAVSMTGFTPADLYTDPDLGCKLVHPDDRPLLENLALGGDALGSPVVQRWIRKDGTLIWIEQRNVPVYDENNQLIAIEGIARDITAQRRTEEALRQSEESYRDLVDNSQEFICTHDLQGNVLSANPAAARMLGYGLNEILRMNIRDILAPHVQDQFEQFIHQLMRDGKASGLMHVRTAAGESRLWDYDSSLRADGENTPIVRGMARDVTERKQVEAALRESQERLASVIYSAMDAVIILDENQHIVLINPAAEKMFECLAADVIGKPIDGFIPERYRSAHRKHIESFGQTGETRRAMNHQTMIYGLRTNGVEFPIEASISSNSSAGQKLFTVILRDISERMRAQTAIQESEKHYRNIFNGVQDAIFVESLDGRILDVNDRACELYGYTREEFLTKTIFDLVPEGQPVMMAGVTSVSLSPVETINLKADGEHFPIEISGRAQTINGDDQEVLLIIVRDITERKHAELAVLESEAALRKAQQVAHVGSWVWHIPDDRLEWSDEMFHIFGIDRSSFTGSLPDVINSAIHPDDRPAVERSNQTVIQDKNPVPLEYRIVLSNGEVRTVWAEAGELILDDAGQPVALSGIVQDITERKQAEERLRDTRQFFRNTLDALSAHIAILDETGTIIAVNESWRKFGRENGLAYGESGVGHSYLSISKLAAGDAAETSLEVANAIEAMLVNDMSGGSQAFEYPCHSPWEKRWFIARLTKFFEHGKARVVVSHENITERKLAEEKTKQQLLRLAALREIDQAITSSLDVWPSLSVILSQILRLLNVDAASILMIHPENGTVEYFAGSGFRTTRLQAERVRLGESYAGKAALERRTIQIPDLSAGYDEQFYTRIMKDEGFISYSGTPLIIKDEVIGVLEVYRRSLMHPDEEWLDFLKMLAGQAAIAIDNSRLFADLQRANSELLMAYDATIEGWSRAMDLRDKETEGHTRRVTDLTIHLARIFGIGDDELIHFRRGCLLHDIGKMGVPDHILLKPGKLSPAEWEIMRQHPKYAYDMLSPIEFLKPALDIPYCHHERWDGTGYPRGLRGAKIPFSARLFSVVDVWDALMNDRPYRPAWTREMALAYIRQQSGKHFDPQIVDLFLQVMDGD